MPAPLRLKIEINTREHFAEHGLQRAPFGVNSRWFSGACDITTYDLDELLGTKFRALYQRRKGRDLFDISLALSSGAVVGALQEVQAQCRERRQPMFTHVVACHMRQTYTNVRAGRRSGANGERMGFRQRLRDRPPAPGAGKIEPVQVGDLAVGAITGARRFENRGGRALGGLWQKRREPLLEFLVVQEATHAFRFHERGRQEIVLAGLPGLRAAIAAIPSDRLVTQERE